MLRKILIPTYLSFFISSVFAQSVSVEEKKNPIVMGTPGISKTSPELAEQADRIAADIKKAFDTAYGTTVQKEMKSQDTKDMTRKFDAIADQALSQDRDKILEFMGIPPTSNTGLYYFVSFSMPLPLIRSYVMDAMWSGGTVVFRGITPGKKLNEFLIDDVRSLINGKGPAAAVSIDPRMYDLIGIDKVPAIAYVEDKSVLDCFDPIKTAFKDDDMSSEGSVDTCRPAKNGYYKIYGAVSGGYALELFEQNGAKGIKPYRDALAKGYSLGIVSQKEQASFSGKWEDVLTPGEQKAIKEAVPVPR